jgi:toxin HigB-1
MPQDCRANWQCMNRASGPPDMNLPGWALHRLKGSLSEQWSVSVSGNWRLTFKFDNGDAILVDYQDYH